MSKKLYWKGIEDLNQESQIMEGLRNKEFVEEIPTDKFLGDKTALESGSTSRRDFLKYLGFSTAAVTLAACEGPVVKSIPYVVKPENVNPGMPDYYASSISDGQDFASVLVRTREGRPIRLEPNRSANFYSRTNARIQASVLSLYDNSRIKSPKKSGSDISWASADAEIISALNSVSAEGKQIVLMTPSMFSPSTSALIADFAAAFPGFKHIAFDAISSSAALDANKELTGNRRLPLYKFEEARCIVSFGADFLGDWLGGGYEKGYALGRDPKQDQMSRHIQVESLMSLTGANADKRYILKPSEVNFALVNLYNLISGESLPSKATPIDENLKAIASELKSAGSKALVVAGSNDKNAQLIAMKINMALSSQAMCLGKGSYIREGNDAELAQLLKDMNAGNVGAIITYNVNPVYSLSANGQFVSGLAKAKLKVAMSQLMDETAVAMDYVLPSQHSLESWGDSMPVDGEYVLMQPTIRPLYDSRQLQCNLLAWSQAGVSYYDYLRNYWNTQILSNKIGSSWNQALHDGVFSLGLESSSPSFNNVDLYAAASALVAKKVSGFEMELYVKSSMGNGDWANNPWLQELPDPITRASWDNYLTVSPKQAKELGLRNWNESNGALNGDVVKISKGSTSVNVPVFIQPGQAYGTFGLAVGYGRMEGLKKEMQVGVNAYPFADGFDNYTSDISIEKVEGEHGFACVQLHHTMMDRDVVQETTFDIYKNKDKEEWNPVVALETHKGKQPVSKIDLWQEHDRSVGHHFNLSIDLNSCTGCSACVVACHAENNVPVVGKSEVRKSRDMHWLRIDRYYSSDMTKEKAKDEGFSGVSGAIEMYAQMEIASEDPQVVFQPVMCQHCNHAPCETVCPVAATSHGKQGQNQMAYNRCVGTRYCANNCPYKVRRFNWFQYAQNDEFNYHFNDEVGRLVINPDVVVRSRGVMEKCSMCIQITQAGILAAKKDGRKLEDLDIQTACASACPSNAIKFGDINDESSSIQEAFNDDRKYYLLEAVGTKPNVMYQTKIRNTKS